MKNKHSDDERTLETVSMDIMMRSIAARGLDLGNLPTMGFGGKGKAFS